jgi:hypothetical protein
MVKKLINQLTHYLLTSNIINIFKTSSMETLNTINKDEKQIHH